MIIGIDGNEANVGKRVGISEYSFELLRQFEEFKIHPFDKFRTKFKIYLKNKPLAFLPKESDNWSYRIVKPSKLWTQIGLPINLFTRKPKPDIFFSPTHYAPRFSPIPTVISVMDLSFLHFPELFKKSDLYQLKNWTAYSVKKASKIFTISKASKNDIIRKYGVPEDKVVVTYPGLKFKIQNSKFKVQSMDELKKKYGISGKFILFVGTLQPRKNIEKLIEAYSKIVEENDFPVLVIVGKKGWLYEDILKAPKKYGVEDKVKFLDFVPNEDLPILYQNALFFILPSLYEGFGLPVLEAMQNSCPVITSNVSSLPEAGGDAALYVDPKDTGDIASKMKLLINDEKLRKELIEKGHQQVKKFSWEKTAKETLKVLEEVVLQK
ncbi:glycosyltransferase family 1 protein [Candidatus Microgenomates bacterium]|nr:MAG: glycosyltransferase family 1 protein [Candidatus Microgenomates bacterium]